MHSGSVTHPIRFDWAAHGCQDYSLVIQPDSTIRDRIVEERQQLLDNYGLKVLPAGAFITVAQFAAREGMEETLVRWIQRICSQQESFVVTFNNYGGQPPHTIYLRIMDHGPFRQLAWQLRAIDEFIRSSSCPPATLVSRPCLSLSGPLPEAIYEKALPDFSRRFFHESFTAAELLLQKRDPFTGHTRTIHIFRMLPAALHPPKN
ncbi:MAG: hypothetical protein P0Y53_03515 [Candidatus Pseudobacter hemicellulosilyticus]|uniref:2'-5' RNA ligase superfamily protein n=1 Tax=Candidatus Pseudobacter hemicellulosilyticus TaxID=3121375 RepID=A0AAJ6BGV7_9BACT|nr:MAG: hypothetical protein P0Y53_03515 [Pseudobacter sp.]